MQDTHRSDLHTAVRPRTLQRGGNKERTGEKDPRLTKTIANLSSSSPGSGMGSFRGMVCPLKSVCWSMLPAFPMFPLWPTSTTFLPPRPLEKISARREGKISARPLVYLGCSLRVSPGPSHFFKIKHMWGRRLRSLRWGISTAETGDLESWLTPRGPVCAVIRILHNLGSTPNRQ